MENLWTFAHVPQEMKPFQQIRMAGDMPRTFEPNEAQEIRQAIEKASNLVYLADAAKTLDETDGYLDKAEEHFQKITELLCRSSGMKRVA
jgi:hypothetical protein